MLGSIGSQDGDVVQSLRKQLDEAQRLLGQKDGEVKDLENKMFEQKASTFIKVKKSRKKLFLLQMSGDINGTLSYI